MFFLVFNIFNIIWEFCCLMIKWMFFGELFVLWVFFSKLISNCLICMVLVCKFIGVGIFRVNLYCCFNCVIIFVYLMGVNIGVGNLVNFL